MELLNTLAGCDHLLICDAVQTGAPPATVIELANAEVPAFFQTTRFSPHQLGLADVLATLALTGEAPRTVTLVGVVPLDLDLGIDLSPEIAAVVDMATERLAAELRELGLALPPRPARSAARPAALPQ